MAATSRWAMTLVLCAAATALAEETDLEAIKMAWFDAPVTVAADGHATIGQLSGVSGALAEAVRVQLGLLTFVPAQRDGVAVDSASHLWGRVVLTPADEDNYDVRVQGVSVAPRPVKVDMPRYPASQLRMGRSGAVELAIRVGPDGGIQQVRTISSSHGDFERAVRNALVHWHYEPGVVPSGAELTVPVWFHLEEFKQRSARPGFQCTLDPAMAHVEGEDGCARAIEVVGTRVGSGTIRIPI